LIQPVTPTPTASDVERFAVPVQRNVWSVVDGELPSK
jgi:hypothetical protein